jgi:hypothetical protein
MDHMPYLPFVIFHQECSPTDSKNSFRFPSTWPYFTPGHKVCVLSLDPSRCAHLQQLANWLEFYAEALDLNVWTSSFVSNASPNSSNTTWTVTIKRSDGHEQVFREVKHVVFAPGVGDDAAKVPVYPGMVWMHPLVSYCGAELMCP